MIGNVRINNKPGVLRRGLAWVLDIVFLSLFFFFPITYWYSGTWVMGPSQHLWGIFDPICAVFLVMIFVYLIFMEAYLGWTVGKKILGMQVMDYNNNRIGLRKSVIRNLLRMIDGLPAFNILGITLITSSEKGQRFGDRIAKTYVDFSPR
ncbi:RDD family protein [Chloroflexota bacterium]